MAHAVGAQALVLGRWVGGSVPQASPKARAGTLWAPRATCACRSTQEGSADPGRSFRYLGAAKAEVACFVPGEPHIPLCQAQVGAFTL